MATSNMPQIGQIVRVNRGRESGSYAVIIGVVDQRYVWIADGGQRKSDAPKKKNVIHLELLPAISSEVADSIMNTGRVTNGKLRFALTKYADHESAKAQEKGE
ncbi:KOW domain-containing RNA-binding protein [Paenibacillus tianmuensis]|uniref:KOW domain-containing RNA-binding protein n=1 Tax=Paenibacillus tianmuensis TaxID=624147 RepID=UPI000B84872B|nr:KOW domain-containing RNA-binding protein [Paenibacillus tianmuensis]